MGEFRSFAANDHRSDKKAVDKQINPWRLEVALPRPGSGIGGIIAYSVLSSNTVFIVTNTMLLLSSLVGVYIYFRDR